MCQTERKHKSTHHSFTQNRLLITLSPTPNLKTFSSLNPYTFIPCCWLSLLWSHVPLHVSHTNFIFSLGCDRFFLFFLALESLYLQVPHFYTGRFFLCSIFSLCLRSNDHTGLPDYIFFKCHPSQLSKIYFRVDTIGYGYTCPCAQLGLKSLWTGNSGP